MFQLYDNTRRRVCIAAFFVLGVLPVALVAAWCANRYLPGHLRAEAEQLGRQLGLDVRLEGLKHLRPGAVLYEGLEIADPETGQVLLKCRLLEVASQQSDDRDRRRPTLALLASQPEIEAAAIGRLWELLQRTVECHHGRLDADLRIAAGEVTLQAGADSQTLTDVEGSLETLPAGTDAQVRFRLAGADTPEPIRIRVVRNRQLSPPASGFELYTGGGELPCNVLAMGLGELKPLGARCRFRGYLWANETPQGWEGEITGQMARLDLGGLVSDHFPHRLSGSGELVIQSARFRRGRLEEASGTLAVGPGMIDRSLIEAAADRLGLTPGKGDSPIFGPTLRVQARKSGQSPERPNAAERIAYEQLAFSLTLDAAGVKLQGRCTTGEPGTILADRNGRLLGEAVEQPKPIAALVQTLVPQSAVQVPASRQTDWLLRHLPVPEVMPPDPESAPSHARLRLRETQQK